MDASCFDISPLLAPDRINAICNFTFHRALIPLVGASLFAAMGTRPTQASPAADRLASASTARAALPVERRRMMKRSAMFSVLLPVD
jgi:hypothetical protein